MASAHSKAGFTLVEMMIVMAIIGIMSAAIMPSMTDVLADHRQASATMDVVRLGRKARALTMASGVAHTVSFQAGGDGLGRIDVLRGATSRCLTTPWDQVPGSPGATLAMRIYNPSRGNNPRADDRARHVILLEASYRGTIRDRVQVCYQPDGATYVFATPNLPLARQAYQEPVTMTVRGSIDGLRYGQTRDVIFIAGNTARVR